MNAPTEKDTRLYAIECLVGTEKREIVALVKATNKAAAVSHYVAATTTARLPTQAELLSLGANPVPIMDSLAYARKEGE